MSEGIRSGVNWIRLYSKSSDSAKLEMRRVLANPGTPTSNAWFLVKIAMRTCSMTSSCPIITFLSSLLTRSAELCIFSTVELSTDSVDICLMRDVKNFVGISDS